MIIDDPFLVSQTALKAAELAYQVSDSEIQEERIADAVRAAAPHLDAVSSRDATRDVIDYVNEHITATGELDTNRFRAWLYAKWIIGGGPHAEG